MREAQLDLLVWFHYQVTRSLENLVGWLVHTEVNSWEKIEGHI